MFYVFEYFSPIVSKVSYHFEGIIQSQAKELFLGVHSPVQLKVKCHPGVYLFLNEIGSRDVVNGIIWRCGSFICTKELIVKSISLS